MQLAASDEAQLRLAQMARWVTPGVPVSPRFFRALGLPQHDHPDEDLVLLAERHALLSGRRINWRGTYEHAAERFLTHMERRIA